MLSGPLEAAGFGVNLAAGARLGAMVAVWKAFFLQGVRRRLGHKALGER